MTRQKATGQTAVRTKAKQEVPVKKTAAPPVARVRRPPAPAISPAASVTKAKPAARPAPATDAEVEPWTGPPRSLAERLQRIKAMAERINEYVKFMCDVGSLSGTSNDAKEKAVVAFHDRMVIVENQLARIHEELWLG